MRKIKFEELNILKALSIILKISFKEILISGTKIKENYQPDFNEKLISLLTNVVKRGRKQ